MAKHADMATGSSSVPQAHDPAPSFELHDQHDQVVELAHFAGKTVFVYFYPKAMTSGCTTQAQSLRDALGEGELDGVVVIGISPDPVDRLAKFDEKHDLGFTLLSDPDHMAAEAYGVWTLKKLYGREYMGVQRSAFLVGPDATVLAAWPKISPKETVAKLLSALDLT